MAITFDVNNGLAVEDSETIRAAIVADWQAIFDDEDATLNTEPESPAGQIIDSLTALVTAKDTEVLNVANQFNPSVADGRWQDALAKIYFLTRKTAEPTVVTCQCTGLRGTVITQGAIIQNTDGYRLYSINEATIPTSGIAEVSFATEETGAIDIGANTCTTIVTVIPGWDTVNNEVAGVQGRDEESRAEFEARRYASVANNAHGSVSAIYATLANINGVLDVEVLENRHDDPSEQWGVTIEGHSVAICIYGGEDEEIAEGIYRKISNGCGTTGDTAVSYTNEYGSVYEYNIIRPTPRGVKVQVTLREDEDASAVIEDDIKSAIIADFYGANGESGNPRVGLAEVLYASRFVVAVVKTAKVSNLVGIKVGWADEDLEDYITINADEEPALSEDDIVVVSAE